MTVQAKKISFYYDINQPFQIPDLQLSAGQQLLILGRSGSGKTTILHILAGLLRPKSGEVFIDGTSLYTLKGTKLDKFRGKNIGIIFQKPHILAPLTVEENLVLANYFAGKKTDRIQAVLRDLGIDHKQKSLVSDLSEGEAQRVSIARALVNQPKLILADEPTASLDDQNAESVVKLLKAQAEKHQAALVIVTHDQRVKNHISNQITVGI
jgi:putative ABC transport system ATP-binding protein